MFTKVDCIFLDSSKRSENTNMYFFLSVYLCYQTCTKNNILFSNMYLVNMNRQRKSANMLNGRWNFSLVARWSLLFVCCSLLFVRCLLLFACCSLLSTGCSLLFARYSLLFACCLLLFARCSLLVTFYSLLNKKFWRIFF